MSERAGSRIRHKESGRLGTVRSVVNGPDALDLDDTVDVVEWDDVLPGEEFTADPELRAVAHLVELVEEAP